MAKKKATKKVVKTKKVQGTTVYAKVSGGKMQTIECETLGELKEELDVQNYQATVDGEPQNDNNLRLKNDAVVILTAPVKGA